MSLHGQTAPSSEASPIMKEATLADVCLTIRAIYIASLMVRRPTQGASTDVSIANRSHEEGLALTVCVFTRGL